MTESLYFDTDCLSAFLWINNQCLLSKLYPRRVVIPSEVYTELSNPSIPHLKERVDLMIQNNEAIVMELHTNTEEYSLFRKLSNKPDPGHKVIGKGEAAAIALVKTNGGILASNNLKDIQIYISEYNLEHITTADIMKEAMNRGLITENEGNDLWYEMLRRRRKLGYSSFSEFLESQKEEN